MLKSRNGVFLCDCGNKHITSLTSVKHENCCIVLKPSGISARNIYYGKYKTSAKKRGYCFELTIEQFAEITQRNCYYCDLPPIYEFDHYSHRKYKCNGPYICNGVDRKDNSKGYILENCVPCCSQCNRGKMDHSAEEYIEKCRAVVRKHGI